MSDEVRFFMTGRNMTEYQERLHAPLDTRGDGMLRDKPTTSEAEPNATDYALVAYTAGDSIIRSRARVLGTSRSKSVLEGAAKEFTEESRAKFSAANPPQEHEHVVFEVQETRRF